MDYVKGDVIHIHKDNVVRESGRKYADMRGTAVEACTCDLRLRVTAKECAVKRTYVAYRHEKGHRVTLPQMWDRLSSQLAATYRIIDGKVLYNEGDYEFGVATETIRNMPLVNSVPIPSVTHAVVPRANKELMPHASLATSYKLWDVKWLSSYIGHISPAYMARHVWHSMEFGDQLYHSGVPRTYSTVPSLRILALRACSSFNRALSYDQHGPKAIFTMSQAYPEKKIAEIRKMNRPTHHVGAFTQALFPMIPEAVELMYAMTGWNKMKAGKTFYWDPDLLDRPHYPQRSSSGWRPGPRIEVKVGPKHKVVCHTVGMKMEQIPYAKKTLREWVEDVQENGPKPLPDAFWMLTDKYEVLGSEDPGERVKMLMKLRQFNIPTTVVHMAAVLVHGLRQKVEKGKYIRVGMQWNYGGAMHLAEELDYTDLDSIIDAADFSRFDKSISKLLLDLYSSSASYYFRDAGDIKLFLDILEAVASVLSVKVTNILADVWRILMGNMPSGAFETSHGDSWINLLLFVMFIVWVLPRMPTRLARELKRDVLSGAVLYVVYGDDHLCKYNKRYYKWINVFERKKWLYKYHDMELRDCKVFRSEGSTPALITRIDYATGRVLKEGPVFLQHYFVLKDDVRITRKDVCDVLPYRKTFKTYYKFPFGSGSQRMPVDYAMAAIGHAYDTKGTNHISYGFCVHQFNYWTRKCKNFWTQVKTTWKRDDKYVYKLCQKAGIDVDILLRGFPSMDALHDMHTMDRAKHRNYAREEFEEAMSMTETLDGYREYSTRDL